MELIMYALNDTVAPIPEEGNICTFKYFAKTPNIEYDQHPKQRKRVTKSYLYECKTWEVNKAKWKAAVEFCEDRRIEFKVITEDELGIK